MKKGIATTALLLANIGLFIYTIFINPVNVNEFGISAVSVLSNKEFGKLCTYMFLHGNLIHLAVNCFSLYSVGITSGMECFVGPYGILATYGISGVLGGLGSVLFSAYAGGTSAITIGASAAVCGLIGMYCYFAKTLQKWNLLIINVGCILVMGILVPNLDMVSHVYGFMTGFVCGIVINRIPAKSAVLGAA